MNSFYRTSTSLLYLLKDDFFFFPAKLKQKQLRSTSNVAIHGCASGLNEDGTRSDEIERWADVLRALYIMDKKQRKGWKKTRKQVKNPSETDTNRFLFCSSIINLLIVAVKSVSLSIETFFKIAPNHLDIYIYFFSDKLEGFLHELLKNFLKED